MTHLNDKNNNNHPIATATTICVLAIVIILVSTSIVTPAAASPTTTTTTTAGNTTTTSSGPSSGIKLSSQPIYQESTPPGNVTPINQTHIGATHTGNGTLTLPNSNQTINTTSNVQPLPHLQHHLLLQKQPSEHQMVRLQLLQFMK